MNSEATTKRCPFCAEEILIDAVKCKHCGSMLGTSPEEAPIKAGAQGDQFGVPLLLIPVVSTLLVIFWVGQMSLIQGPGSSLALVGIVTVAATAALILMEARRVGAGTDSDVSKSGRKRSSPIAWFVGGVLLWFIVYPAWMYQRSKYGLRNLVVGGLLVTLVFSGAYIAMSAAISSQQEEIQSDLTDLQQQLEDLGDPFDSP